MYEKISDLRRHGLGLQIFWTSLVPFANDKMKLMGTTSRLDVPYLWLHGASVPGKPSDPAFSRDLTRQHLFFFSSWQANSLSGSLLSRHGLCPWDYSRARFHYKGLIRPDYFSSGFRGPSL